MEVHTRLGCGFLESVYEEALAYEFTLQNMPFERQKDISVIYKEHPVKHFTCDFVVNNQVIVELKALRTTGNIEKAQVLNYLRATRLPLALLLNFGNQSLEHHRFANTNNRIKNQS